MDISMGSEFIKAGVTAAFALTILSLGEPIKWRWSAYVRRRTAKGELVDICRHSATCIKRLNDIKNCLNENKVPRAVHFEKMLIPTDGTIFTSEVLTHQGLKFIDRTNRAKIRMRNVNCDINFAISALRNGEYEHMVEICEYLIDRFEFIQVALPYTYEKIQPENFGLTNRAPRILTTPLPTERMIE